MPNCSFITIVGHLGRDAELKQVGDSSVCEFSIAVTHKRRGDESTAWYRCALWGRRGESLQPHLTKGKAMIVIGELVPREYRGKGDELRTSLDIKVSEISFAGGGGDSGGSESPSTPAPSRSTADYDPDIPF